MGRVPVPVKAAPSRRPAFVLAAPGDVDPEKVFQLGLVVGPGLMLLYLVTLIFLSRYPITRSRHREILAELEGSTGPEEAELLRAMKFSLARLLDTEEGRRRKRELDRELEEIGERLYEIPPTPEERKALLDEIVDYVRRSAREELGLATGTILGCFLMIQFVATPGALLFARIAGRSGARQTVLVHLSPRYDNRQARQVDLLDRLRALPDHRAADRDRHRLVAAGAAHPGPRQRAA